LKRWTQAIEVEADSHLNYLWQNLGPDEQYALATLELVPSTACDCWNSSA
jgi:hypothetical protein